MSLSFREKILIFILILVVIVFGGVKLLVAPAAEQCQKDKMKYEAALDQQKRAALDISRASKIDSLVQAALQKAEKSDHSVLPEFQNEDANVWFVNLANSKGLTVHMISFDQQSVPSGCRLGELVTSYETGRSSGQSSNSAQSAKNRDTILCTTNLNASLTGSYDEIKSLFDAIRDTERTMEITEFEIKNNGGDVTATVRLNFYSSKKLGSGDDFFKWILPAPSGKSDIM